MELPKEIIYEIQSYGDPYVTKKMNNVLSQLLYNRNEFEYLRKYNRCNCYHNWKKEDFWKFCINRTRAKLVLNVSKLNLLEDRWIY